MYVCMYVYVSTQETCGFLSECMCMLGAPLLQQLSGLAVVVLQVERALREPDRLGHILQPQAMKGQVALAQGSLSILSYDSC